MHQFYNVQHERFSISAAKFYVVKSIVLDLARVTKKESGSWTHVYTVKENKTASQSVRWADK